MKTFPTHASHHVTRERSLPNSISHSCLPTPLFPSLFPPQKRRRRKKKRERCVWQINNRNISETVQDIQSQTNLNRITWKEKRHLRKTSDFYMPPFSNYFPLTVLTRAVKHSAYLPLHDCSTECFWSSGIPVNRLSIMPVHANALTYE